MRRLAAGLVLLLLLAPLPVLLLLGEWDGGGALRNSLPIALAAAPLAMLLGTAAGIGLRDRFAGRGLAWALIALPLLLPPAIPAAAWLLVAEQLGPIAGAAGLALWHALLAAPLVALLVRNALGRVESAQGRAAAACGASPEQSARLLRPRLHPRMGPAMLLGGAVAFALSVGESSLAGLLRAGPLPAALPGGLEAGALLGPAVLLAVLAALLFRPTARPEG
jgi:putative spermidine/putrescine transport system permease protein